MRKKKLLFIPLAILAMALFIFIGGEVVRLLWNWLLPSLFGWRSDHILASGGTACALPHPLRWTWNAWSRALKFPAPRG